MFLMPQNVRNDSGFSERAEENRGHRDVHHDFLEHRHCLRHTHRATTPRSALGPGGAGPRSGHSTRVSPLFAVLGSERPCVSFNGNNADNELPPRPSSRVSLPPVFRPLVPPLRSQRPSVCPLVLYLMS